MATFGRQHLLRLTLMGFVCFVVTSGYIVIGWLGLLAFQRMGLPMWTLLVFLWVFLVPPTLIGFLLYVQNIYVHYLMKDMRTLVQQSEEDRARAVREQNRLEDRLNALMSVPYVPTPVPAPTPAPTPAP